MYTIRVATAEDVDYVASCYGKLSLHIKAQSSGAYVDGLPVEVDQATHDLSMAFIRGDEAIALVAQEGGCLIGCIAATVQPSAFPPSGVADVGHVAMCWVEPAYRGQGVGTELLDQTESWLVSQGVGLVELSYL